MYYREYGTLKTDPDVKNKTKRTIIEFLIPDVKQTIKERIIEYIKNNRMAIFPDSRIFVVEEEYNAYDLYVEAYPEDLKKGGKK